MSTEFSNDDILFDRLVDGELTEAERRRLIESLDGLSDGWRRCAIAFLEAQSWRDELSRMVRGSIPAIDAPSPVRFAESNQAPGDLRTMWRSSAVQWLALAAGLLVAFGLGALQQWHGNRVLPSAPSNGVNIAQSNLPAPVGPKADKQQASNALTLYVRDETGRMQPVRVPLVDASTLDRQLGVKFQPGISENLRNQLQTRGYTVQSKQQYAPLWLENGQPMIVPVEDTKIVPADESVF